MKLGKHGTWIACGLVGFGIVAAGVGADLLLGTAVAFTIVGAVLAVTYLAGTFALSLPLFGRVACPRAEPGSFALTFDDGPDPRHTAEISRLLAGRGHRATFFVLGMHARRYPELLATLIADGHEVANHGEDHRLLALSLPRTLRGQLAATEEAVTAAIGRGPAGLFRPPHGVRSPWLGRIVAHEGYRVCGWMGRVRDTEQPGAAEIASRVTPYLRPGSMILLHDGDGSGRGASRRQTVEALPAILDEAERRGLRSVLLSSLLEPG